MKITQLDNYGEGFRVAPRKPHSASETLGTPLSRAEKSMRIVDIIRSRLDQHGICHVSIFPVKSRRSALNQMRKMQKIELMQIERMADQSGEVIGYKVISQ